MNKISIGQKLRLSFGAIIALTLILGLSAIFFLLSIDRAYSRSYAVNVEPLPLISRAAGEIGRLRLDVSDYVFQRHNAADARLIIDKIERSRAGLRQIIDEAPREIDPAALAELKRQLEDRLFPAVEAIVAEKGLADPDLGPGRRAKIAGHLHSVGLVGIELDDQLSRLLESSVLAGAASSNRLTGLSRSLALVFAALVVMIVLASVGVSLLMIRTVTGPVEQLKRAAEEVARGNLAARIDFQSTDEFGALAESTRQTIASLSEYIGEIKKGLEALGRGDYEHQTRDIFKGDFGAVREAMDHIAGILRRQSRLDDERRRELTEAYEAARQADRAKSDFLSHMSHDIRTPLNAIIGLTGIAQANLNNQTRLRDCLRRIALSGGHLTALINDVLDMSQIERGKMSFNEDNVSLPELMESLINIIEPQAEAKKQSFSIRLRDLEHESLFCDPLRLNQVLINLLSNAVKYTPAGGSVSLELWERPSEKAGWADYEFTVADTGIGIKPEFIGDIFSAFSRESGRKIGRIEGSGLGMAICKSIVDLMGGQIEVRSQEGQGTVFIVRLQLRLAEVRPLEMNLAGLKVLVADGDRPSAQSIGLTLAALGIESDLAAAGPEAVEKARQAAGAGRAFDALIVDLPRPEAESIKPSLGPGGPTIIMSGYHLEDSGRELAGAAGDAFLPKPLFKSTLYYGLKKYVLGQRDQAEPRRVPDWPDFAAHRILLVEDHEVNQLVVTGLLSPTGLAIETAGNGAEALTRFTESEVGRYDLILMDVRMPIMDGYEAARRIRRLPRPDAAVPIVAMTADAFAADVKQALDSGMNGHLPKPVTQSAIVRELGKYLRSPGELAKAEEGDIMRG